MVRALCTLRWYFALTLFAIPELWWNNELAMATASHTLHALAPSLDHFVAPHPELHRTTTIPPFEVLRHRLNLSGSVWGRSAGQRTTVTFLNSI